jgi:porphobilinogen synthase
MNKLIRPRRNRIRPWMREMLAENRVSFSDLILPLFVVEGNNKEEKIVNLPGVSRFSIDLIIQKAKKARDLGIPALMLFPVIDSKLKTDDGREALNENNLICRAVREIKKAVPEIGVICDVALDPYTSHGHDGLIDKNGYVLNDETVAILCQQSLVQAKAGCDIIAPSDMMDGRVEEIRKSLDKEGFINVAIMSYAAKYASNFYGPFRDAVGSIGNLKGDKKTYQMDFRNSLEALNEIELDIAQGADMLIIKPGLPYLDVIKEAAKNYKTPIIAYQVSGEYAMLKHAAAAGAFDFNEAFYETLIAFKRAGARAIITYGALDLKIN